MKMLTIYISVTFLDLFVRNHRSIRIAGYFVNGVSHHLIVRELKYRKNGQAGLDDHMKICGEHKPILPEMPKKGQCIDFKAWKNTVRHPLVIYADFEALLVKMGEKKEGARKLYRNTTL